jgi:two-component system, LuxR family, sensor kinase FixL
VVQSVSNDGRHKSEESEQSELLESLLDLSDLLVVVLDGDGTILLFNRSCEALSGYAASEMIGRSIWSFPLIPDDERPDILRAIANVKAGVSDFRHVNHWITCSGERRLIHWRNTILRDEHGRIDRLFASGIDVTEQQRAVQGRRHQERELHRLLEAFPALVARLDANLHIRFANHGYREWFDLEPVEQLGRHVAEVIGLQAYRVLEPHFRAALSGEQSVYHGKVPYSHGGERFIHGTYVPSRDEAGRVDGLYLLSVDITRERQLHWQVIEQAQRSQAIIDNALDGIICIDLQGRIIGYNPAAERIFGYSLEEVMGKDVAMLMPVQPGEWHEDSVHAYLRSGRKGVVGQRREVIGQRSDGSRMELLLAVTEVVDREHYFIGFVHDISQRKRAEREARRHLTELAHTTRIGALGEVAAGLAHELSQPLTAISANAEACLMRVSAAEETDPVLEPALRQIQRQSQRAGEIIDYLRRFLRKEQVDDLEECMPGELVDRVLMLLNHELHSVGVRVRREIDHAVEPCRINRVQIEQVLFNLAKNAIDALEAVEGERELQIRCGMSSGRDAWEVMVIDNGPGLCPEHMKRLFHPFFTTKSSGLGQGLSICRSIVERHGGLLEGANRPGGGMVFRFSVPLEGTGRE